MAVIQSKKMPVIQKGAGYIYNPLTFAKEHKVPNFHCVDDPQEILDKVKPFEINGRKFIVFDSETYAYFTNSHDIPKEIVRRWVGSGKSAHPQDFPFCLSICDGSDSYCIYDDLDNRYEKFKALAPLFEDPTIEKIAHNWKFDAHMLANINMKIVGRVHDTVVLTKLVNENRRSFELRELAAHKKGSNIKFEYMVDAYKQMNKVSDYRQIPRELMNEYTNADTWNCAIVFKDEYPKLVEQDLEHLYDKECEVMIALYAMERYGMPTDPAYEEPLKAELQVITDEAERAIYEEAGHLFNINSSKQLYQVLVDLGVKEDWISRTDKGNPILDKDALNTLADKYNVTIVQKILEFRKNEKLLNTYAVGIYDQHDADTRVHGNINQTEATTGRMSITKPALQTLPKKDKRIRKVFIPDPGYSMWFMDLDQVEYRLFAHYAKIPSLIEAIKNGYDVHAATASMIFHIELDELLEGMHKHEELADKRKTLIKQQKNGVEGLDAEIASLTTEIDSLQHFADMRSRGKTINFALIYGVGIDHLGEMLKVSSTEASDLKARYFAQLPEAKLFINQVYNVIKVRGFVKNFYGRHRRLDPDDCYKAPNSLIQGCAADYIKEKLVNIFKYLMYHKLDTHMVLIIHDELVIMCKAGEEEHLPALRWMLSDFTNFRCPITAGVEEGGPSWGQKVERLDVDFKEPEDKTYLDYNVYDGRVFDIYKGGTTI